MDEIQRQQADHALQRAGNAESRYSQLTRRAARTQQRVVAATVVLPALGLIVLFDGPALAKASGVALLALSGLGGWLVYAVISRRAGEWTQPLMLMGAERGRRRQVWQGLLLGRLVDDDDIQLVVDLRAKLRTARWVALFCWIGLVAMGPVRMSLRTDTPELLRWMGLLGVPFAVYCIAAGFWMYYRAGKVLDAVALPRHGPLPPSE